MSSPPVILLSLTTLLLKKRKWFALKLRNPYKKFVILLAMMSDQRLLDTSLNWSLQWNLFLSKIWKICTDFWRLRLSVQTTKRHSEFCMISIFQSCSHICYFVQLFSKFHIHLRLLREEEKFKTNHICNHSDIFFWYYQSSAGCLYVCMYVGMYIISIVANLFNLQLWNYGIVFQMWLSKNFCLKTFEHNFFL